MKKIAVILIRYMFFGEKMKPTLAFKLTLVVIFVFAVFLSLSAKAAEDCTDGDTVRLEMSTRESKDGNIEIDLMLSSKIGITALLGELTYSDKSFLFLGCGSEIMDSAYEDIGGSVRFVLDNIDNSPPECVLATFYFTRIGDGDGVFSLELESEAGCVLFNGDGVLISASPECPERITVQDKTNGDSSQILPPCLVLLSLKEKDGARAVLELDVSAPDCFASGIRLFAVDIESGESREYYVLGITDRDRAFCCLTEIDLYKNTAVVVTAVGYKRSGMIFGEKRVIVMP